MPQTYTLVQRHIQALLLFGLTVFKPLGLFLVAFGSVEKACAGDLLGSCTRNYLSSDQCRTTESLMTLHAREEADQPVTLSTCMGCAQRYDD